MGCAESKDHRESRAVNENIEKQIKEEEDKLKDEVKMLLLGKTLVFD